MSMSFLERVAVALDTSDRDEFRRWCRLFGPRVGVLKVGLEAFARWGPDAIAEAKEHGRAVFADLKLHDIPNTVAGAVGAMARLEVDYLTVHAAGGPAMLAAAAGSAGDRLRLLAVTLLTHLDRSVLDVLALPGDGPARALAWARMAQIAGCRGAVCSPAEVARLRGELERPFLLVTPGIRPGPAPANDDQRRTATPEGALDGGSDLLVIGRPLTRAASPERALAELEERLSAAGAAATR